MVKIQCTGQLGIELADVTLQTAFERGSPGERQALAMGIANGQCLRLREVFVVPVIAQALGSARTSLLLRLDQQSAQWFALLLIFKAFTQLHMQRGEAFECLDTMRDATQNHSPDRLLSLDQATLRAVFSEDHYPRQMTTPVWRRAGQ
ncbi:hypothetical protein D3C80_1612780 [compost metagenome]